MKPEKSRYYLLNPDKTVQEIDDLLTWARAFGAQDRRVAETFIGDIRVSTVFLGLNHDFTYTRSRPLLFETMIFGGKNDGYQERYSTWAEALEGHDAAIKLAKEEE